MKVFSLKKYMADCRYKEASEWAKQCDGQPVVNNTCRGKNGVSYYIFHDEWCEKVPYGKVIFSGKATVLIKDGKKYVSKCKDGDAYDKEKGLLLCLAQANGISYRDLQEMIAGAKDCNKAQVREVEREAKVGEYIKIVEPDCTFGDYDKGSIFKVKTVCEDGDVEVEQYKGDAVTYIYRREYVVLENYKPYKITLSEFWKREERLAIYCEDEAQIERLCETMLKRGFKNKNKSENFSTFDRYVLNDKHCICVAINQARDELDCKTVYKFNEVDLEN